MGSRIGEPDQESRSPRLWSLCLRGESTMANNGAFEDLLVVGYHKSVLSTTKCCTDIQYDANMIFELNTVYLGDLEYFP